MSRLDRSLLKRLLYQSSHRGCKETDLILGNFAEKFLEKFDNDSLLLYEQILLEADADIVDWVMKRQDPPKHIDKKIISQIIQNSNS